MRAALLVLCVLGVACGGKQPSSSPKVQTVVVTLDPAYLEVGGHGHASAQVLDADGKPLTDRTVTWTSSNEAVAKVSSTGDVTPVAAGDATISASCEGVSGGAKVSVAAPQPAGVHILFQDGFESGDLSAHQGGVAWSGNSYVDVTGAISHSGGKAARFRQGESGNWAELRFDGLPGLSEVFIQFYLYYPSGNENPSVGPKVVVTGTRNDKFFRLWGNSDGDYGAQPGDKVGASVWGDGSGTDGEVGIEYEYSGDPSGQWGMGEGNPGQPRAPLVDDAHRGRWLEVRIRCKTATAANDDGAIQLWIDRGLVVSNTALQTYPYGTGPNTYTTGYLLGAANNGFVPGQMTYIDDVTISTGGFPEP